MSQLPLEGIDTPAATCRRGSVMTLNELDVEVVKVVSGYRDQQAIANGYRDRSHVATKDGLRINLDGAAAELAASKYFDLRWTMHANDPGASDLTGLNGVEVRHTRRSDGHLIVRDRDHDDRPYVLVVGEIPSFRIVGWLYGREAKRYPSPYGDDSHWVPQQDLRPL